ncbi:MAG: ABC transporter ATP-binding protein [Gammaproteobacteria bacterium]
MDNCKTTHTHSDTPAGKLLLAIEHLDLCVGDAPVIRDLNLHVHHGEIICLLGASGCGKTTVLRAIAGFIRPTNGVITLDGALTANPDYLVPPEKRHVGMIFQDYALFPHLTIRENLAFGLKSLEKPVREQRITHYFSNLDVCLRRELQRQLRSALQKENMTAILVTHDQEEAFAMADRIGLLAFGQLQQLASPYTLYHEPANRYVASFIGLGSFITASVADQHHLDTEVGVIESRAPLTRPRGHRMDMLLRPDDILPNPEANIQACVQRKIFKGASTLYTLTLANGTVLEAIFPSHYDYPVGSYIHIDIKANHVIVFDTAPENI